MERILKLDNHGVVTELMHIHSSDVVELEDDVVKIVPAQVPVFEETFETDVDNDDTPGPLTTTRTMVDAG